jgi:hypothetical protein
VSKEFEKMALFRGNLIISKVGNVVVFSDIKM